MAPIQAWILVLIVGLLASPKARAGDGETSFHELVTGRLAELSLRIQDVRSRIVQDGFNERFRAEAERTKQAIREKIENLNQLIREGDKARMQDERPYLVATEKNLTLDWLDEQFERAKQNMEAAHVHAETWRPNRSRNGAEMVSLYNDSYRFHDGMKERFRILALAMYLLLDETASLEDLMTALVSQESEDRQLDVVKNYKKGIRGCQNLVGAAIER